MAGKPVSKKFSLLPRFRVTRGQSIALGPGKVELLAVLQETGSIAEAAKRMEMSYMRAWSLLQTMNECFREPLVKTVRGGHQRGGAELTKTGVRALELYRRMQTDSLQTVQADWRTLQKLLQQ